MKKESKFTKLLRFKRWFYTHKFKRTARGLDLIYRIVFGCDIPSSVPLGGGTLFEHCGLGCVVHPWSKIGENCRISSHTTIGCRSKVGPPILGDDVSVEFGACVLGKIVIGNHVKISANAVVLHDVPDYCVVSGIPGKIQED